jgi:hypothetical protein
MAEIEMERKPSRGPWLWIAAAVLVLVLAVGAYFLLEGRATGADTAPAAERPGTTQPYVEPAEEPYVERPDTLETPEETRRP